MSSPVEGALEEAFDEDEFRAGMRAGGATEEEIRVATPAFKRGRLVGIEESAAARSGHDGLQEALRFAFTSWGERDDWEYDEITDMPETPEHDCRFEHAPDEGYCAWHDEFWKAYLLAFTPGVALSPEA